MLLKSRRRPQSPERPLAALCYSTHPLLHTPCRTGRWHQKARIRKEKKKTRRWKKGILVKKCVREFSISLPRNPRLHREFCFLGNVQRKWVEMCLWPTVDLCLLKMWPSFSLTFRRCVTCRRLEVSSVSVLLLSIDPSTFDTKSDRFSFFLQSNYPSPVSVVQQQWKSGLCSFVLVLLWRPRRGEWVSSSSSAHTLTTSFTSSFMVFIQPQVKRPGQEEEVATSGCGRRPVTGNMEVFMSSLRPCTATKASVPLHLEEMISALSCMWALIHIVIYSETNISAWGSFQLVVVSEYFCSYSDTWVSYHEILNFISELARQQHKLMEKPANHELVPEARVFVLENEQNNWKRKMSLCSILKCIHQIHI